MLIFITSTSPSTENWEAITWITRSPDQSLKEQIVYKGELQTLILKQEERSRKRATGAQKNKSWILTWRVWGEVEKGGHSAEGLEGQPNLCVSRWTRCQKIQTGEQEGNRKKIQLRIGPESFHFLISNTDIKRQNSNHSPLSAVRGNLLFSPPLTHLMKLDSSLLSKSPWKVPISVSVKSFSETEEVFLLDHLFFAQVS